MEVDLPQILVRKDRGEVLRGKGALIGPVLDHGHQEDHHEDGQEHQTQHRAGKAPGPVPQGISLQLRAADPVIADVVPLQEPQQQDAPHRGQQHDDGHHGPPVKVGDAPQHLVVENRGNHVELAPHGGGDAEVGEAQEEGLDKSPRQGAQQRAEHGDPEGG